MDNQVTQNILNTITTRAEVCFDRELTNREINPRAQGQNLSFHLEYYLELPLTNGAMSQFLNRLQIPIIFYKKCPIELQQSILNEFNSRNRSFLIRSIRENTGEVCRAVLSNHFSRDKDDVHIYPPALGALNEFDTSLQQFSCDPDYTQLVANFDDCRIEQDGAVMTASMTLLNSETGHSSVWIYPNVTINGFSYANRRGDTSNNLHRIIHRGQLKQEEFQQVIRDTKNIAQVGLVQYMRARTETVTTEHAKDFIETIEEFPKRFASILNNEWENEQQLVKVNVMQRVMQLAQELPLFQKVAVSRQVGRFIRLFENTDRERAEITEQLRS